MTDSIHDQIRQKAVVTVSETDLGAGLTDLRWRLRDLVMDGTCLVVIDVSELRDLPSTLLAALLDTHRVCRGRGGGVVIRRPSRKMYDVLRRTGLSHVFDVEAA